MFYSKVPIRRFGFKPYYYDPEKEANEDGGIKFRRILKSPRPEPKPVRRWLIMAIAVAVMIWYLGKVNASRPIQVETIIIEDITPQSTTR